MDVGIYSTIFYTIDSWEIKVEGCENTDHSTTGKHDVKMTNDVESIVKQDVHTSMGYTHT
jgi:hypothetical protein